jgi:hypothetical protein
MIGISMSTSLSSGHPPVVRSTIAQSRTDRVKMAGGAAGDDVVTERKSCREEEKKAQDESMDGFAQ